MPNRSFTELNVYQKCRELRLEVSKSMRQQLPGDEKFRLLDQVIRSSRSVTANIAEGHGRFYFKENIRFCRNSRGSLDETLEHCQTALDEGYIDQSSFDRFSGLYLDARRLLDGYIRYLNKAQPGK